MFIATTLSATPCTLLAEDKKDEGAATSWSIGAGVGFGYYRLPYSSFGASAGQTGLTGLAGGVSGINVFSPFGVLLVERQLTKHLCLLFDVAGSYTTWDSDNSDPIVEYRSSKSALVNATIGLRWIFNPSGIVEVSGIMSVGALWNYDNVEQQVASTDEYGELEYLKEDSHGHLYSGGLEFGLALERKLLDNLFLRFQSSVVCAYYGQGNYTTSVPEGSTGTQTSKRFDIALAFSPMIQLRLLI